MSSLASIMCSVVYFLVKENLWARLHFKRDLIKKVDSVT